MPAIEAKFAPRPISPARASLAALVAVLLPVPIMLGLLDIQQRYFGFCGADAECHREGDIPIDASLALFALFISVMASALAAMPAWLVLHLLGRAEARTALLVGAVIGGALGLFLGGGLQDWPITVAQTLAGAVIGWLAYLIAYRSGPAGRPPNMTGN